jgi:hypothetical protein
MSDHRSWMERLADRVPGYRGYADKEHRRDTDKLEREHLADRVRAVKTPLGDVVRDLSGAGRLFEVGPVERVIKKLDRVENRIRYASYGYSGFFDAVKVQEAELDSIYRFDLSLVQRVDALEEKARGLRAQAETAAGLKAAAADLEGALDEFEHYFDGRHNAVNSFGQGQEPPSPRSMFNE